MLSSRNRLLPQKSVGSTAKDEPQFHQYASVSTDLTTPFAARSRCSYRLLSDVVSPEVYDGLLNSNWETHSVSPLTFRHPSTKTLPSLQRELQVELSIEWEVHVSVSSLDGLRVSLTDPEAIRITVTENLGHGRPHVCCDVILGSFDTRDPAEIGLEKWKLWLPLALSRGKIKICETVFRLLTMHFDCNFVPLKLDPLNMKWMSAMWCDSNSAMGETVDLTYNIYSSVTKNISSLTIQISFIDINRLWKCVHDVESEEFRADEVEAFHRALQSEVSSCGGVFLDNCQLHECVLPTVQFNSVGKVKIFCAKSTPRILRFLTNIAQQLFLHPELQQL